MEFQTIYISSLPTREWISKVGRTVYDLHAGTLLHRTSNEHHDSITSIDDDDTTDNASIGAELMDPIQLTDSESFIDLVLGAGETVGLAQAEPLCEPMAASPRS